MFENYSKLVKLNLDYAFLKGKPKSHKILNSNWHKTGSIVLRLTNFFNLSIFIWTLRATLICISAVLPLPFPRLQPLCYAFMTARHSQLSPLGGPYPSHPPPSRYLSTSASLSTNQRRVYDGVKDGRQSFQCLFVRVGSDILRWFALSVLRLQRWIVEGASACWKNQKRNDTNNPWNLA